MSLVQARKEAEEESKRRREELEAEVEKERREKEEADENRRQEERAQLEKERAEWESTQRKKIEEGFKYFSPLINMFLTALERSLKQLLQKCVFFNAKFLLDAFVLEHSLAL